MGSELGKAFQKPEDELLMKKVFSSYDKNHNSSLERKEFNRLAKDFYNYLQKKHKKEIEEGKKMAAQMMKNLPKEMRKNVKLEKTDISKFTNDLFEAVDKDKNGEISYEEFKEWCIKTYEQEEKKN
eukprot:TRINITY_DN17952_c0_g1_i1.p1 TRINITY_DN17952_c0_g1~~TRINITY_DN17952_c0_g1_i1.p1  ORF type:complete len:126 (-),score=48.71 TRINITY_DN17952_c0_g1_i1:83-460(-)